MSKLLEIRKTQFALWKPRNVDPPPKLVIGIFRNGNPPEIVNQQSFPLKQNSIISDIWEISPVDCQLVDKQVYHYWFEVKDSLPETPNPGVIRCTDPLASSVDWRVVVPSAGANPLYQYPPAVVKYSGGLLVPCDASGEIPDWNGDGNIQDLPENNRLVMYELPTRWARITTIGGVEFGIGTFRDVMALMDKKVRPANFSGLLAAEENNAHLAELGINSLELLPVADSFDDMGWGYATSNYFAPDYDLGFPKGNPSPTPNVDLTELVKVFHKNNVRFFSDMVMAFATRCPVRNINFLDFFVQMGTNDPEEFIMDAFGNRLHRDVFGGDAFKYNFWISGYDPLTGTNTDHVSSRQLMKLFLTRWMTDFRLDGIRLDSVVNYGNWDFMQEFKDLARELWRERASFQGLDQAAIDKRFLVVGEELSVPLELINQKRLDGLWNEKFKQILRSAILGESFGDDDFEWTIRKLIDCRLLGFSDLTQAVNYITSHDVEGYRNGRLYTFLKDLGFNDEMIAKRVKLSFVCLLTAVGIPMIFAGEEFADQHDRLPVVHPQKQVDPVNFDRREQPWRKDVFKYVSRLVKLRTRHDALSVNDTDFFHVDFSDQKRVVSWKRGTGSNVVVVVANFSDYGTSFAGTNLNAEYRVNNWPALIDGHQWREVTQDRIVPNDWAGREPIFPWEAKVYEMVDF
ncbi:hypothetical protein HK098_003368 [Nowakowskiella sp. JEL0407]|nr:hypothetical protein HK098_003368 [Nowakowskiella sp. JEL0407]